MIINRYKLFSFYQIETDQSFAIPLSIMLKFPDKYLIIIRVNCFFQVYNPADTGRKLNVHKTFRRRPRRLQNVLCTFNLRPLPTGKYPEREFIIIRLGQMFSMMNIRALFVEEIILKPN